MNCTSRPASSPSLPTSRSSAEGLDSLPQRSTTSFERRNVNQPKADSPFYSGRNPVPRIGSLWEIYPHRRASPDNQLEEERRRRIEEHSILVSDPVTGRDIKICDAKYAPPLEIARTAPDAYPPTLWSQFMEEFRSFTLKYMAFIASTFVLLNGVLRLPYSISIFIAVGGAISWWRRVEGLWADVVFYEQSDRGNQRMNTPVPEGNESVEWLNGAISKLWPQINADLFSTLVDLIEDVMQASMPPVVNQVKITSVGQGSTPIRILSMRWLNEGGEKGANVRLDEQEEVGEWVSLELAFAYRASPSSSDAPSKAKNASLLIHLTLGLQGVLETPIPVWIELRGCTGTCRLKLQTIPDPPFIKLATFTLLGMPKIEIAAVPLNQRFLNVMNLPIISDFVNSSIRAAARSYVAPSNYTFDVSKVLTGDDIKKDTNAIGVLVVHIHSAEAVKAADLNGKSDCYVTLSYLKFAKPLWSTRIIFGDLSPVWDETAVLLVNADEVKASEMLSVELWDSDRFTVDDMVGKTDVDVTDLVRNRGKVYKRRDSLRGYERGQTVPGHLNWSVVFHGKAELNESAGTDGADERLPDDMKNHPDFKSSPDSKPMTRDFLATYVPPAPFLPSGILSVQIHNIVALETHTVSGTKSRSNPHLRKEQTQAIEEEESSSLPSAYCSIILDYQKIYKTRVKPMTSKPFFNAGTERFVRDYRESTVLVVVEDSRNRESDPILGAVELKLDKVFQNSSVISRYYPIQGGVGYGKIRISLLFRSIDTSLPKQMLGADVGSVEVVSRFISAQDIADGQVAGAGHLTFRTPLSKRNARQAVAVSAAPGWSLEGKRFRLSVRHRYALPCILYFRRDSVVRRDKCLAIAMLWLKDIPDDEETTVRLGVYQPEDIDRFVQNCGDALGVGRCVGSVVLTVRFRRGLTPTHRKLDGMDDICRALKCIDHHHHHDDASSASSCSSGSSSGEDTDSGEEVGEGRSPIEGIKRKLSRKKESIGELHRRERGAMQWKGARTLAWVGRGVVGKGKDLKGKFAMEPRRPGVETEVP
ncbi:hypothetical protein HOY80DRAFT_959482 [Tuber brumale]|nr:hypothetical protein HOY80DRAFT_959482 [Tuber brumale]